MIDGATAVLTRTRLTETI